MKKTTFGFIASPRFPRSPFVLLLLTATSLCAQVAPSAVPDAATLARYDRNGNGRLDPGELTALEADQKRTVPLDSASREEAVMLSPFEVVADSHGYHATNTMSGTRLNTKLEDLASSITVMTKEQMLDLALLDMNDVFMYTGNTEGTATYTEFNIDDGQGALTDATSGDPGNANRVRGIGKANVSISGFESSNRVPLDVIDTEAVEVSRGPNANIFGLGNASGTVNIVGASASIARNRTTAGVRADSFDGHRRASISTVSS